MDQKGSQNELTFSLSPAKTLVMGALLGVMTICTIGFFITLPIVLGGDMASTGTKGTTNTLAANPTPTAAAQPQAQQANGQPAQINLPKVDPDTDHIWGNDDAKLTLVEYSDFECPYCGRFFSTVEQIKDTYGDDVKIVYRHFPLSFHPNAKKLAYASECAAEQGKFWELHDAIFNAYNAGNRDWSDTKIAELASGVGLSGTAITTCANSGKYDAKVAADMAGGQQAGVRGTPHTIIMTEDGTTIPLSGAQPFASVKAVIDQYLN
jgi:protein-disulfide isomerase